MTRDLSAMTIPLPLQVADILVDGGVRFAASVPCNTLGGLLDALRDDHRLLHVPVTREEEGVGLCAGAALAGRLPLLLMQNSGLGNCINALLSLTTLYALPLLLLASYRGGPDEQISAQIPMGRATIPLLRSLDIHLREIKHPSESGLLAELVAHAGSGRIAAGIIHPSFWKHGI